MEEIIYIAIGNMKVFVFFFQVRSSNLSGKKITFPKIVRKEKENENVKNKWYYGKDRILESFLRVPPIVPLSLCWRHIPAQLNYMHHEIPAGEVSEGSTGTHLSLL